MFGLFGGNKHRGYKPVAPDSPPSSNNSQYSKSSRLAATTQYSQYVLVGLSLSVVILLFLLIQKQATDSQDQAAFTKLQRALNVAEESSRILLNKHTHEMKTNLLDLDQKEKKIDELDKEIKRLNREILDLSCEAGRVDMKPPDPDTIREKVYNLPDVKGQPGLAVVASADSEPGINHIIGQYRNDQYHVGQLSLDENDLVIDVGAHVGCFTLNVARLFPNTKVVAVEPLPPNFHFLKENVDRLGLTNVVLVNKGVSSHNHPMRFWLNPGNTGGSSAFEVHTEHEYCVPTVTLEALINEYGQGKNRVIVNMDCEGCEYDSVFEAPLDKITHLQLETHEHMTRLLPKKLVERMPIISSKAHAHMKWY